MHSENTSHTRQISAEINLFLHVYFARYVCPILTNTDVALQLLVKLHNIKRHEVSAVLRFMYVYRRSERLSEFSRNSEAKRKVLEIPEFNPNHSSNV